jgi:hypothetical protein
MSCIQQGHILDMMIEHYQRGYSITQLCWYYHFPVEDIHETFVALNILDHKKKLLQFTPHQKRLISKALNPQKKVKKPTSYNGYLKLEIEKMEHRLLSDEYSQEQKERIKSTIKRYKFIIKRHYTKYNPTESYELVGI